MSYDFGIKKAASLQHVRAEFLSYFVGFAIIALILGVCLHFLITRRLERLRGAMADFAAGKPVTTMSVRPGDEISELVAGFNDMAATIGEEMQLRRRTERELRDAMAEVQGLYDHAPCGYHSLNADGVFIRINDTELKWLGYTQEEMVGKMRFADVIAEREWNLFESEFQQFKKQGVAKNLEFEMICKDGSRRSMLLNSTAIYGGAGEFVMSRSTVTDITERKRAEERIGYLASIVESTDDAVIGKTLDGTIISWNRGAERVYAIRRRK